MSTLGLGGITGRHGSGGGTGTDMYGRRRSFGDRMKESMHDLRGCKACNNNTIVRMCVTSMYLHVI